MRQITRIAIVVGTCCLAFGQTRVAPVTTDVLVIGAGPGGLSTALEAGQRGLRVTVVDMSSVFGGHAVVSEGALALVDTPLQRAQGIHDSPDLALQDFVTWGEDPNPAWAKLYAERSRVDIHDWLTAMGVRFTSLRTPAGNSVARYHENPERGYGVVKPIYRECLRTEGITFEWNTRITDITIRDGRVIGATGVRLRTGAAVEFRAQTVVVATGGFQSNAGLVRQHWPGGHPPDRILLGSGVNSTGSGLELAAKAGAVFTGLDRQWNYTWGFPDPRDSTGTRGVYIRIMSAIWVNQRGERFVDEVSSAKLQMGDIARQPGGRYWAIFDAPGKASILTAGTDWADPARVEQLIFGSPLVTSAPALPDLARAIGVPEDGLVDAVKRYNGLVASGRDQDFGRFGAGRDRGQLAQRVPQAIRQPPFYAMPLYVLTRKSMGGVRIDASSRVLTARGDPVPGLFAVGEVSGFGGLNGKAGLEGTFIAPSMLQGRMVGRLLAPSANATSTATSTPRVVSAPAPSMDAPATAEACVTCHDLPALTSTSRAGYWHFERAHRVVLDRAWTCTRCHKEVSRFPGAAHKIDRVAQIDICVGCHVSPQVK
jgi:succinate dehydrogenase/fumarate reductase flavoprotein subunit